MHACCLDRYGGPNTIAQSSHVVNFEEYDDKVLGRSQVAVDLEDGRRFTGDMLIGADGIWSKIRKQMIGETEANYSEYTCYTGVERDAGHCDAMLLDCACPHWVFKVVLLQTSFARYLGCM